MNLCLALRLSKDYWDQEAIVIGRQNCHESGMGSTNENSAYGITKNGLDPNKVPGGSSGGSVRQPASFCGVVGLKPSYSRISRWGLLAYASSFYTIGIFSKSISDTELVLETIARQDERDAISSTTQVENVTTQEKP